MVKLGTIDGRRVQVLAEAFDDLPHLHLLQPHGRQALHADHRAQEIAGDAAGAVAPPTQAFTRRRIPAPEMSEKCQKIEGGHGPEPVTP